ncbi:MAG: amidohydrolase [Bacteroidota bacterium]
MKHVATLFIVVLSMLYARGQQVQKSTYENVLLTNATVHTITEGTLTDTDVHIVDGRIAAVGVDITAPAGTTIIDCSDHHIYPGFIDSGTRLGLIEVGAVSLTNDYNEIGDIIPQMQALTAVNPNSVSIPVTRVNGVTTALAVPSGGIFPGTAGLIHLQGYTPEQMSAGFEGVVMNFPSSGKRGRWDRRSEDDIKKAKEKALKKITEVWDELAVYHKIDSAAAATNQSFDRYQPEMSALLPVYRGEQKLLINVNKDDDIIAAIEWISETGVDAILVGVAEGYRVAEEIAEAGVPVITGPVLSIPGRASARYDVNYKNAGVMQQAGVKVAIQTTDAENVRNLPFNAGFAATYGMGIEEALKATFTPACCNFWYRR